VHTLHQPLCLIICLVVVAQPVGQRWQQHPAPDRRRLWVVIGGAFLLTLLQVSTQVTRPAYAHAKCNCCPCAVPHGWTWRIGGARWKYRPGSSTVATWGLLQEESAAAHLPLGSLPCMLATYLKLGSGSATPGLSEISKPHSSTPPALLPMLCRGGRSTSVSRTTAPHQALHGVGSSCWAGCQPCHLNLRVMLLQRCAYSSPHAACSQGDQSVYIAEPAPDGQMLPRAAYQLFVAEILGQYSI
jgi:hypothetical protein